MKWMVDDAAPEIIKNSARQTLYTCLDNGFLFPPIHAVRHGRTLAAVSPPTQWLHTLYHGLVQPCGGKRLGFHKLLHAAHRILPQDNTFVFEDAEKEFDLIFKGVASSRSLAASYSLLNDIQRMVLSWSTLNILPDTSFTISLLPRIFR